MRPGAPINAFSAFALVRRNRGKRFPTGTVRASAPRPGRRTAPTAPSARRYRDRGSCRTRRSGVRRACQPSANSCALGSSARKRSSAASSSRERDEPADSTELRSRRSRTEHRGDTGVGVTQTHDLFGSRTLAEHLQRVARPMSAMWTDASMMLPSVHSATQLAAATSSRTSAAVQGRGGIFVFGVRRAAPLRRAPSRLRRGRRRCPEGSSATSDRMITWSWLTSTNPPCTANRSCDRRRTSRSHRRRPRARRGTARGPAQERDVAAAERAHDDHLRPRPRRAPARARRAAPARRSSSPAASWPWRAPTRRRRR